MAEELQERLNELSRLSDESYTKTSYKILKGHDEIHVLFF